MRLFTKKTNVRRSTRSRNRMFQNFDFNFEITSDDIPPFGVHRDPPARQVTTLKKVAPQTSRWPRRRVAHPGVRWPAPNPDLGGRQPVRKTVPLMSTVTRTIAILRALAPVMGFLVGGDATGPQG